MLTVGRFDRRRILRVFVRKYQFRFVFANLVFFCLIGAMFVGLLFGPLAVSLLDPNANLADLEEAASAFLILHKRIWLLLGLVSLFGTVRLAIVSHRVAGPLVRFTRIFRSMQSGDVSMRVKIRDGDYLHPEAAALDATVRTIRRRLHAAKSRAARLGVALDGLREAPGREPALDEALQAVDHELRALRRHLDTFRTQPITIGERGTQSVDVAAKQAPAPSPAGFTLIELLLVVAIIGTVGAIGAPAYAQALDTAKVARAMADIRAISRDIEVTKITTGHPPNSLAEAGYGAHKDPYGRPYQYLRIDNLKGKGAVRKDRKLNPLNSDFDLYSVGKDGKTKVQISNKDSLDDIVRATDGAFIGLGKNF